MIGGGPVTWSSKKQKILATSTAEAEFIAAAATYRITNWVAELLESVEVEHNTPKLVMDSTCAIEAIKTSCTGKRVRFINLRYRYLCHGLDNNDFVVDFTPGIKNIADILTKPLDPVNHSRLCEGMGLPKPLVVGVKGDVGAVTRTTSVEPGVSLTLPKSPGDT
jgi:hypothetical protein